MAQSILASFPQRTSPEAVTQQKPQGNGINITGQYLYDRFMTDDTQAEMSKMNVVRLAVQSVEPGEFKKALKDFVELAAKQGEAQRKTAQNHQTVMRLAYGALRFAGDTLEKLDGFKGNQTGYQAMRVLGKKALEQAGIKWDGTKVVDPEAKQKARATKEAQAAMLKAQKDNPQNDGESFGEWMQRITPIAEKNIEAINEEKRNDAIKAIAQKFVNQCGPALDEVLAYIEEHREELEAARDMAENGEPTDDEGESQPEAQAEPVNEEQREPAHA